MPGKEIVGKEDSYVDQIHFHRSGVKLIFEDLMKLIARSKRIRNLS
jgi:hypothetical protein